MAGIVAPREGRVSRNPRRSQSIPGHPVAPREGRVSRNGKGNKEQEVYLVAPREGCVSRNVIQLCVVWIFDVLHQDT